MFASTSQGAAVDTLDASACLQTGAWAPSDGASSHDREAVAALEARRAQLLSELAEVDHALRQRTAAPSSTGFEQPQPIAMPESGLIETDDGLRYMGLPPESHWLMTTTGVQNANRTRDLSCRFLGEKRTPSLSTSIPTTHTHICSLHLIRLSCVDPVCHYRGRALLLC